MPGPVSDSYDSEFSTRANAQDVRDGIEEVVKVIGGVIGDELREIVGVAQGQQGDAVTLVLSERQARLARFGLKYAMDAI